jgi:ubiquinone/menaquinone biosynthesis C-methylase UbiE
MRILTPDGHYQGRVLRYYNRFARLYDLGEFIRRGARRKAMLLSGWRKGDRVLDICTGTGELALMFASQGMNVIGCDLAWSMLKRASEKGRGTNTKWLEMDATRLAFAENSFEISVLSLALHHMPAPVQINVLSEMRRVTSRRIVIIEPDVPVKPNWVPAYIFVASIIDESEYMHEWVTQDFVGTCESAGLRVEAVHGSTFGLHRILLCNPNGFEG